MKAGYESETSAIERWLDRVTAAGGAVLALGTALTFLAVKGPIPTHFDRAGQPDAWGSKGVLLVVVLIATVVSNQFFALRGLPVAPHPRRPYREMLAAMGAGLTWSFAMTVLFMGGLGAGLLPPPGRGLLVVTYLGLLGPVAVFGVRVLLGWAAQRNVG